MHVHKLDFSSVLFLSFLQCASELSFVLWPFAPDSEECRAVLAFQWKRRGRATVPSLLLFSIKSILRNHFLAQVLLSFYLIIVPGFPETRLETLTCNADIEQSRKSFTAS